MTKTLELTLTVREEDYDIDVYDPESGEFVSFRFDRNDDACEIDGVLGNEIRSWVYLMQDHLDDESVV